MGFQLVLKAGENFLSNVFKGPTTNNNAAGISEELVNSPVSPPTSIRDFNSPWEKRPDFSAAISASERLKEF